MDSSKDYWLKPQLFLIYVVAIVAIGFFCVSKPTEQLKKEPPPCFYSEFRLPNEGLTVCCKKAMITYCGVTVAFCEGKIPMFLCEQNVSCLNGELCQELPNWIKK